MDMNENDSWLPALPFFMPKYIDIFHQKFRLTKKTHENISRFGSGFNWIIGLYNKPSLEPYQFNGREKGTRDKPSLLWLLNHNRLDFDDFSGLVVGILG
jgi:hypothetical protein